METQIPHTSSSSLFRFNRCDQGASLEIPHKLIHQIISKIARDHPLEVAVVHDGDQITYGALDLALTNLFCKLLSLGIRPQDRVVLLLQRSIPMVVVIFAVLRSGCQYAPVDERASSDDNVPQQVSFEADPPFVLCPARHSQSVHQFSSHSINILSLEELLTGPADFDTESEYDVFVNSKGGAYTMFTLGQYYLRPSMVPDLEL